MTIGEGTGAASLSIGNAPTLIAGTLAIGPGGTVDLAGGLLDINTGGLYGSTVGQPGTIFNDGLIAASGHFDEISGHMSGDGTVLIGPSTSLQLDSWIESGQTIAFASDSGTLTLDPVLFFGTIAHYQSGDVIALSDVIAPTGATSGTLAGDLLTVYAGNVQTGRVAFSQPPIDLSLTNGSISIPVSDYVPGVGVETYSWTGALSTDFSTPGNWNDVSDDDMLAVYAPGSLDTAEFVSSGGTISGTGTVASLSFAPTAGATNADWFVNGTLNSLGLLAISAPGDTITMTVANGGRLASQGLVNVGDGGNASLEILAGSTLASASMYIAVNVAGSPLSAGVLAGDGTPANASTTGTVSVSGDGAELDVVGALAVGVSAAGTLIVSGGGGVVAGNLLVGSDGLVDLIGGVLSDSTGAFGTPSANLSSDGTIDNAGTIALSGGTQVLNAIGTVTNTGVIVSTGSAVAIYGSDQEINNSVFGAGGTLAIGNEGDLQLDDAVGSGQIAAFLPGGTGELTLFDPGGFAGRISGFQTGDVIDAMGATSGIAAGNVVTLFYGSEQLGTLTFASAVPDLTVTDSNSNTNSNSEAEIAVGYSNITTSADVSVSTIAGGLQYIATSANDVISTVAGENNLVFLGAGGDTAYSVGTDTLIGAAGAATINATGNAVAFASNALNFINGSGSSVIALGGAGSVTGGTGKVEVFGGSGGLYATGGSAGGNGLVAGSGNATLTGGGGGDIFVGGSANSTDSITTVGTLSAIFGGAATMQVNDTSSGQYFVAGAGSDTINQAGGTEGIFMSSGNIVLNVGTASGLDIIAMFSGAAGGSATINGFSLGNEILYLGGYGANEATNALSGATLSAAGATLTFSDGTRITLGGITNLASITNAGSSLFYP